MQPLIQFKRTTSLLLIPLLLACFGLSPRAQAVVPAPDGGYPGGNTAEGAQALFSLTTGGANTAVGFQALFRNTTGVDNAATGWRALFHNTIGDVNTANGAGALFSNTIGDVNTANGAGALFSNTIGDDNTANGASALFSNTTGNNNTANGTGALFSNTTGSDNTTNGLNALYNNTTGDFNTANGFYALFSNTTGDSNTATGYGALGGNTTGVENTAEGEAALGSNTTGSGNTANGQGALFRNTTGTNNVALGVSAGFDLTTGDNNIDIGNLGGAAESNTIRIGGDLGLGLGSQTATYIAAIFGATVANGVTVIVDAFGHLGTIASSKRFKDEIKPMDKASEAILALKPVTFRYKQEFDPKGVPQFGLVAEEVEKVNPDLVARDAKGEVFTVRYEAVNAMLLNEFLKAHGKLQEQEATIARVTSTDAKQEAMIANQQKQIEALTAGLQRVSAQIELNRSEPKTVQNNR